MSVCSEMLDDMHLRRYSDSDLKCGRVDQTGHKSEGESEWESMVGFDIGSGDWLM